MSERAAYKTVDHSDAATRARPSGCWGLGPAKRRPALARWRRRISPTFRSRAWRRSRSCAAPSRTGESAPSRSAAPPRQVFFASDIAFAKPIVAVGASAGFKSNYPALASDKARFVGDLLAICVAPTRAEAEESRNPASSTSRSCRPSGISTSRSQPARPPSMTAGRTTSLRDPHRDRRPPRRSARARR